MSTRHRRNDVDLSAAKRRRQKSAPWPRADADDHARRLARLRVLCKSLDDMHEMSGRICDAITAEARRANGAAPSTAQPRRRKKPGTPR
jgi:hypothetical protein